MSIHLIYWKIYSELSVFELVNLFEISIFKNGVIHYLMSRKRNFWQIISLFDISEEFMETFKYHLEWDIVLRHKMNIPVKYYREFKDTLNWKNISFGSILSEAFIREFEDKVDWEHISQYQKLSEDFIREFRDKVFWNKISEFQVLSEPMIREFKDCLNWTLVSKFQVLSETFIKEFRAYVDWLDVLVYQDLTEDFIVNIIPISDINPSKLSFIIHHKKLSNRFIRTFSDNIDWFYISKFRTLSEDFIREFKDKVYWPYISKYQELTEDFIQEFKDQVYWPEIVIHQNVTRKFIIDVLYSGYLSDKAVENILNYRY